MNQNNQVLINSIGVIHTPYKEKFAVPRQPRLTDAISTIEFFKPYDDENAFVGIEGFSHLYVIFLFDKIEYDKFKPKVRPPRLGGNTSVGVFATRSPFRPNRLGLSVLELKRVINEKGHVKLEVLGADLVDGTPIIDVKPYIPFTDSIPNAIGGFASTYPTQYEVEFENNTKEYLQNLGENQFETIYKTLSQDPRPAYKDNTNDTKLYKAKLYDVVICFKFENNKIIVVDIER